MLQRVCRVAILCALAAPSLLAVTYVVPSDRDLVRRADAIFIGSAVESHAIATAAGGIATRTTFRVDEAVKGTFENSVQITEPGGAIEARMLTIPGAPRFENGTRYLLFLHRTPDGDLTTYGLGLGRFDFDRDVLSRGAVHGALGWNELDGSPYVEPMRSAPAFLDFVRTVSKNPDSPVASSYVLPPSKAISQLVLHPAPNFVRSDYLFNSKPRWNNKATASFDYCCASTFQPNFDGPGAITTATGMWDAVADIHYTTGVVSTANGGLRTSDNKSGVLFNDPNNELAAFGSGVVALGGFFSLGTYTLGADTFAQTQEADVVVGKTSQFPNGVSQALFAAVMTHEMGHTLGFRHSDATGDPSSARGTCAAPLPCSSGSQSIMESLVGRTTLGLWDIDAAVTVYGALCANPVITQQPANQTNTGGGVTLSVTATGTSPTYQWFQGNPPSGTAISGATGSSVVVNPSSSTNYYVVVTACGTSVTSNAATVSFSSGPCGSSSTELCLNSSRYRVTLTASDPSGKTAQGVPFKQSNVFGYFALPGLTGDASNPEVFVKTVGPVNGVPWVFYAGLTNLDYNLRVTDTQGSFNQTYHVPPPASRGLSGFQSIGDYDVAGATSTNCSSITVGTSAGTPGGGCANSTSTLCLLNRFRVTLQAKDNPSRSNNTGPGVTVTVNSVFGFFTTPALAPDPSDIQVFVKMVDATGFNGKFWVFLGGLTDLEFTVTVADSNTGVVRTYKKDAGNTCGWNDTGAFNP